MFENTTTFKELLISFLKSKNRVIHDLTGLDLYDQVDIAEIQETWSEEEAREFLSSFDVLNAASGCPWCHSSNNCHTCTFGRRHGICLNNDNNLFSKITEVCLFFSKPSYKHLVAETLGHASTVGGRKLMKSLTKEEALLWSLRIWSRTAHAGSSNKVFDPDEVAELFSYYDCPLCLQAGRRRGAFPKEFAHCLVWGTCGRNPRCQQEEFGDWHVFGGSKAAWAVFDRILKTYEETLQRASDLNNQ